MKKIYLLALALGAFVVSGNAQIIDDDMELYNLGEMGTQNSLTWTSWTNDGGASNDGFIVTDAQASSGDKSLVTEGDQGRDPLLLLGNQTSGDYTVYWNCEAEISETKQKACSKFHPFFQINFREMHAKACTPKSGPALIFHHLDICPPGPHLPQVRSAFFSNLLLILFLLSI